MEAKRLGGIYGNFLSTALCRNTLNKQVQKKSRRNGNRQRANNQNHLLVPVDVAPITFNHSFPEAGGVFQLNPPNSWNDDKRPVRISSFVLDHSSSVPCSLSVSFSSNVGNILRTINITSSMTSKRIKLRCPKNIDYCNSGVVISVLSTGPAFITGLGTFTAKAVGVE